MEITVALISLVGVIYTATVGAFLAYVKKQRDDHTKQIDALSREAQVEAAQLFHAQVTSPYYPIKEWTNFVKKVRSICENTEIDRVLLLVALNGIDNPRHATVVWEHRSEGETHYYIDVPIDDDYVRRLMATKQGPIHFKTANIAGTRIGHFYSDEAVTEAMWAMIGKRTSFTTEQVAYKYISVATHSQFTDPKEIERLVYDLVADFRPIAAASKFGPI